MKIKLIKISRLIALLKPISILLIFLSFPFTAHIGENIVTICTIIFLGTYLFLTFVIRKYGIVGYIVITNDNIVIEYLNKQTIICLDKEVIITLKYSGYKGQPAKGTGTPLFNLAFEDGIGKLIINDNVQEYQYKFLIESKNDLLKIEKLSEKNTNGFLNILLIKD